MPAGTPSRRTALALLLLLAACAADPAGRIRLQPGAAHAGPRILAVTAHPDDEAAFGGTLYKAATFLEAACDLIVITNGEGGFKYATLAERTYGLELTDEAVGRRHLPAIRRAELLAAAEVLALRDVQLLGQADHRYTQDVAELLGPAGGPEPDVWDLELVRGALRERMRAGRYDLVLTLAPTPRTHAHHQAAALLAVEAAASLPEELRPVCLAVDVGADRDAPAPETVARPYAALAPGPPLVFDRSQRFGHAGRLDYRIVVNQAIAQHRSQGTMQLFVNGGPLERYFPYAANPPGARARAAAVFDALRGEQFPARDYGESAGTNAGAR